jgi:hypothetical protein
MLVFDTPLIRHIIRERKLFLSQIFYAIAMPVPAHAANRPSPCGTCPKLIIASIYVKRRACRDLARGTESLHHLSEPHSNILHASC